MPQWRLRANPSKHRFCNLKCYGEYKSKNPKDYPLYYRSYRIRTAKILTKDVLKKEYQENKLRLIDIAKKYDSTYGIVQKRMKKYGIHTESGRYSNKDSESYWRRTLNAEHNHTCQFCKWNKDNCDVHHMVPRKDGGKWERDNLILVCPNCHRLLHRGKLKI